MAVLNLMITILSVMMGSLAVHTPSDSTIISGLQFGSIMTYFKTTSYVYHMEMDLYVPGNLLYSDGPSLKSTDGKTNFVVAGHPTSTGYMEGSSTKALFRLLTSFLQITTYLVLAVDRGNHCLRIVSRINATTSPFTGICGSPGYTDGVFNAKFNWPYSVVRDPFMTDRVFVADTDNNALRTVHLVTKKVETFVKIGMKGPCYVSIDKNLQEIYLAHGPNFGKIDYHTGIYTSIISKINMGSHDDAIDRTSLTGATELLKFNKNIFLIADKDSHKVRIVDLKQSMVRSICSRGFSPSSLIDGPITNCSFRYPTSLLLNGSSLYIGEFQTIRRLTVQSYEPECLSRTMYVTLKPYQKTTPVEVTPGVIMYYPIGNYYYEVPGRNCKVTIIVTPEKCPDPIFLVADSATGIATFSFEAAGHLSEIQLPVGSYSFTSRAEGPNCFRDVTVMSPTLKRRLDFKAVYDLSCKALDGLDAVPMLQAAANRQYDAIERFCDGECTKPAADGVLISCENDKTTVTWTTGRLYAANVFSIPKSIRNWVYNKMKLCRNCLELAVHLDVPYVISPNMNKDQAQASMVLTPVCMKGTSDKLLDSCSDVVMSSCCKTLQHWYSLARVNEDRSYTSIS